MCHFSPLTSAVHWGIFSLKLFYVLLTQHYKISHIEFRPIVNNIPGKTMKKLGNVFTNYDKALDLKPLSSDRKEVEREFAVKTAVNSKI